jgi:DmsE family decaheme c-type cytochrome
MLRYQDPAISVYTTTSRQQSYQLCVSCHKDLRAQMNKPSHHPVIEGKMSCADCHNPHGTLNSSMIKAETTRDLCLSCHADKRGPWIHEHPPVEENCMNCHTPHGSNHNRMLAMKPPHLCQECHRTGAASTGGHPGTLVDGRPIQAPANATSISARFQEGGCVNCHRQIHGSNSPTTVWGNAFVR